jgi:hypothetical protein
MNKTGTAFLLGCQSKLDSNGSDSAGIEKGSACCSLNERKQPTFIDFSEMD